MAHTQAFETCLIDTRANGARTLKKSDALMTTQTQSRARRLEAPLGSLLARLRGRIRAYIWADGLALVLATAGIGFWASLALDWTFEPPRFLRASLLAVATAALAAVAVRFLLARLLVRLADRNMALLVERRFGQFRDSLLTAVELSERPERASGFNAEMLANTHRDALAHSTGVDLGEIFNPAPLARHVSLAAALVSSVLVFGVLSPNAFGIWARRNVLLSEELWPRKTRLVVEGFDERGAIKIARGSDWNLVVKADAALGREIPEIVEVRYSTSDGARSRENMSREGIVVPGQAPFQSYSHTFKGVLAALEFYVRGGDDRRGPYHLLVVDNPTISQTLHCEYPAYMRRAPRDLPVAGLMQVPRGTEITIRSAANKPLVAVQIDDMADENTPITHRQELAQEHGQPPRSFEYQLPRLDGDKTLLFTLFDADGIRSREAVRLAIASMPDEAPQVNVQLKGIGTAITSAARLPASGEVSDDYGVAKVWFDYRVDDRPAAQSPLSEPDDGPQQVAVEGALEVRDLQLQPKQKLHWSVQASDGCAIEGGPNVGTSQQYALDVVTPEQLRSILEARELTLRRRFETIVEELTETRNLLAAIATRQQEKTGEAKTVEDASRDPGDANSTDESSRRATLNPAVQAERVLQNSQRTAHETLQVAQTFDEILEEMINNRVDTEELKTRLKDGVADPLRRIVNEMFPKWEGQLKQLAGQLADPQAAPAAQAAAIAQADAILVEMKAVLDKMLELETFNEVLDMLRQIISAQEKVNANTKQKQKQKLRDLVE
jgi:hypothetical protein